MDIEFPDPARRGRGIVILGVVMGILAAAGAFYVVQKARVEAGGSGVVRVPVVVAAREISPRTPIVADDLVVRDIPIDDTTEVGTYTDPAPLLGFVSVVPVLPGQPVLSNMLAGAASGADIALLEATETIEPDSPFWRGVTLTVPDDRAAAGLIEAGQTVDIMATVQITLPDALLSDGRYTSARSTKLVYQDMLIVAKAESTYVLKAPVDVAEELGHLVASGDASFTMLVRPPQDLRPVDGSRLGTTTGELIRRYGLPIPEAFPPGSGQVPTPQPVASSAPSVQGEASVPTPTPGSDETAPPAR